MFTKRTIKILLCFGMVIFVLPAFSQFGLKAGVGVSDIFFSKNGQAPYLGYEVDYLTHNYPAFSYQFSVFGTVELNKRFEFQPELAFVKQGLNYNISFIYDEVIYKLDIYYLQLPLLFNCKFGLTKKHQPLLFAGPYGSLKLNTKRTTEYNGQKTEEPMDNVRSYDFGIIVGFGYNFNLNKGQIITEFRTSYGLVNMMDYLDGHLSNYETPFTERARNVNISLLFGYRFMTLKKRKP